MSILSGVMSGIANFKPMKYVTNPLAGSAAGTIAVISTTSKDAVGCYYYVTQSLKNDKIPEKKRKFVAALDLTNGVLMVVSQLIIGKQLIKYSGAFFKKYIAKNFFTPEMAEKILIKLQEIPRFKNFKLEKLKERMNLAEKAAKVGFEFTTTLIGTTVIAKRMLVPFLATPLAGWVKTHWMKDDNASNASGDTLVANGSRQQSQIMFANNHTNDHKHNNQLMDLYMKIATPAKSHL